MSLREVLSYQRMEKNPIPLNWTGIIVERDFYSERYCCDEEGTQTLRRVHFGIMWGEGVAVQ
jgi:hypothetical protein